MKYGVLGRVRSDKAALGGLASLLCLAMLHKEDFRSWSPGTTIIAESSPEFSE